MSEIAQTFPSLRQADGVSPWNAWQLHDWAKQTARDPMARHAVEFLLMLWHPARFSGFSLFHALPEWDEEHRRAFSTWAGRPYWPRIDWPVEERSL